MARQVQSGWRASGTNTGTWLLGSLVLVAAVFGYREWMNSQKDDATADAYASGVKAGADWMSMYDFSFNLCRLALPARPFDQCLQQALTDAGPKPAGTVIFTP